MADARNEAQRNEQNVFGANPARATDGKPLERGVGSRWAGMRATERTHYLAVEAQAAAEDVINAGKALTAAAERFMAANQVVVAEAAKAKDEPVPPAPLSAETDAQRVERERREGRPYVTAGVGTGVGETDEQRAARLNAERTERDRVAALGTETERQRLAEAERQRVERLARQPALP